MFAENLKKLRKEKELSQEEMAAKLNVVGRTYGSWELNEREPDFSTLFKSATFTPVLRHMHKQKSPAQCKASLRMRP